MVGDAWETVSSRHNRDAALMNSETVTTWTRPAQVRDKFPAQEPGREHKVQALTKEVSAKSVLANRVTLSLSVTLQSRPHAQE